MHIKYPHNLRRNIQMLVIAFGCVASSFFIGMQSAGNVTPVALIKAGGTHIAGDVDGNGAVDVQDVILILEIEAGYQEATVDQRKADPNGDGVLNIYDALRILSVLSLQ